MRENNRIKQIKQLIQQTMNAVDLNIEIKHKNCGVNMSYNFIGNFIGFDAQRIDECLSELTTPVPIDVYISLFTLHELGHALDREALLNSLPRTIEFFEMKNKHSLYEQYSDEKLLAMLIEEHEMNIIFEQTAWTNAEKLNKQYHIVDEIIFQKLKMHSLATYQNLYMGDLELYNNLVKEKDMQIS